MAIKITGIWQKEQPIAKKVTTIFNTIYPKRPDSLTHKWETPHFHLNISWDAWHTKPFATDPNTETSLIITGTVYDDQGIVEIEKLLAIYLKNGISALKMLNGTYIAIVWTPSSGNIEIVSDKYGLKKIYILATLKKKLKKYHYENSSYNNFLDLHFA